MGANRKRVKMNIEQIKQIALDTGLLLKTTNMDLCPSYLTKLQAFANASIKAYVAEQKPTIWFTQKEFDTLKRAQKTDRETVPLYDLTTKEI